MLNSVLGLLALFGYLGGATTTLSVSDEQAVGLRGDVADYGPVFDVINNPRASVGVWWSRFNLGLGYGPRISLVDVFGKDTRFFSEGDRQLLILHQGIVTGTYDSGRFRLELAQSVEIGRRNFAALVPLSGAALLPSASSDPTGGTGTAPTPTGPLGMPVTRTELVPNALNLRILNESSSGRALYAINPRLTAIATGMYSIQGGYGRAAQRLLPSQRTTTASASLQYDLTSSQDLTTQVIGSRIIVSNSYQYRVATVLEGWNRRWTPSTATLLAGGATLSWRRSPDDSRVLALAPAGVASLSQRVIRQSSETLFQMGATYLQTVNPLSGILQGNLVMGVSSQVTFGKSRVTVGLGAIQTVPRDDPSSSTVLSASTGAQHSPLDWLTLAVNGSVQDQRLSDAVISLPLLWAATASVAVQAPPLRF